MSTTLIMAAATFTPTSVATGSVTGTGAGTAGTGFAGTGFAGIGGAGDRYDAVVGMFTLSPMQWLGEQAKEGLADAWTATMISLWSAGMWLLQAVFAILDSFLTPDLADGGLGKLYGVTLWVSLVVAVVVAFGQVGLAAARRDGASLGSLVVGLVQYGAVVCCWVAVCGALVVACAGLTTGLLQVLLDIDDFSGYQAAAGWPEQVGGTVAATALGITALFLLLPAAFGMVLIMLVREAGLLILTATMPIAAAGALGEGTRAWMWRSVRWFAAACLTAPLLAIVLGLGVQITRAAFPDGPETTTPPLVPGVEFVDSASQVGMAVVGCVIMVIACFCPMVLFRLLAFVDPGTSSGAAFRSSMTAHGGISGLMTGKTNTAGGSGAATQTGDDGRTTAESSADAETANRFQSRLAQVAGPVAKTVAGTMSGLGAIAAHGAAVGVDVLGQSGVGSQGYYDTTAPGRKGSNRGPVRTRIGSGTNNDDPDSPDSPDNTGGRDNTGRPHNTSNPGYVGGDEAGGTSHLPRPQAPTPARRPGSQLGNQGGVPGGGPGGAGAAGVADDAVFLA